MGRKDIRHRAFKQGASKMAEIDFEMTATEVARGAGTAAETVRLYADLGLIPVRRLGNGVRLFRKNAVDEVRTIRDRRLANRGRRPA